MNNVKILEGLFDSKKIAILKLLLAEKDKQFYLREIAKLTNVSPATTFRILQKLLNFELVKQIQIKKFKLYQISDNENITFLDAFLKEGKRILEYFVDVAKKVEGVQFIILHGSETEEKANLLLIGDGIDANQIKALSAQIKEDYNYTISSLTLTKEQYTQMSNMGLYSGKKQILFKAT